MLVTIHQPNFLPWPGFFHKWMMADAIILLDTVQYEKNEWQNRNRIKTAQGAQWLTVPVRYRFPERINEVSIADQRWPRKLCGSIEQAYARAPYLKTYWPQLRDILNEPCQSLRDMNAALIRAVGGFLDCQAPVYIAADLAVDNTDPTDRLLELCAKLDADAYLSGQEGQSYLDAEAFARSELKLYFQQVDAPVYQQLHGDFISHLSILDLLLNLGPEAAVVVKKMGGMTV
ncbi:MAG: WbqC family protein [Mariprofundaceae bacterium]|nr:WbqC family protein [Mariprofundaceae bacterium]